MLCKKLKSAIFLSPATQTNVCCIRKVSMFYIAHIRSILTYCMPAIFPLLTKTQIEFLENAQKSCTKMILPSSECCYERQNVLSLPPLALFSENLYWTHFVKIMSDEHHQLHTMKYPSTVIYLRGSLPAAVILQDWRTVIWWDHEQPRDRPHY